MNYPDDVPSVSRKFSALLGVSAVGFAIQGGLTSSDMSLLTASVLAFSAIVIAWVGMYVGFYVVEGTA